MQPERSDRPLQPRRPEHFDAYYGGTRPPAWDIGRPQPAFVALAEAGEGEIRGRILDAGCGTGEHALMAAALGFDATGIDTSAAAIAVAQRKAVERAASVRFEVRDALDVVSMAQRFDTVIDCGLFHIFDDDDRTRYVEGLGEVLAPGGRYLMMCFSDRQPGSAGPRRMGQARSTPASAAAGGSTRSTRSPWS